MKLNEWMDAKVQMMDLANKLGLNCGNCEAFVYKGRDYEADGLYPGDYGYCRRTGEDKASCAYCADCGVKPKNMEQ